MSDGGMRMEFYEPGALVPALEVFDAVSNGSVDASYTSTGFHAGKIPHMVFFGSVDRKSTRLNSSHANISYAVFCLKKKTLKTMNRVPALTHSFMPITISAYECTMPLYRSIATFAITWPVL